MDMNQRLVIPINASNQELVGRFKTEAAKRNIPYTRAIAEALQMWLGDSEPVTDPVTRALDDFGNRLVDLVAAQVSGDAVSTSVTPGTGVYTVGVDNGVHDPFAAPDPEPESLIPPPVPEYRRPAPTENPW